MLSGETSVGKHPLESVAVMARIIETTEDHGLERIAPLGSRPSTKGGAITAAAVEIAEFLDVKYLVTFTQSGDSARRMARLRSRIPLLAFTPEAAVRSQLSLTWGIETFLTPYVTHTDEMVAQVERAPAGRRPLRARRRGRHRRRLASRHPRLDQRRAGAPDRRRDRGTGSGVRRPGLMTVAFRSAETS